MIFQRPLVFGPFPATLSPESEQKFKDALTLLDDQLAENKYVAGDNLTIADLSILASLSFSEAADYSLEVYSNVDEWRKRLANELLGYEEINREALNNFRLYIKSRGK